MKHGMKACGKVEKPRKKQRDFPTFPQALPINLFSENPALRAGIIKNGGDY